MVNLKERYILKEEISKIKIPNYSLSEEIINSLSHGIAAAFSIAGLILMIVKASHESVTNLVTVTIFGTTMIILYTMSCIYHALSPHIMGKKILRVIDHTNVFLLVLGTILPVSLVGIGGIQGCFFFGFVAIVTLVGIFASCVNIDKVQWIEVLCHLMNGWSVLLFVKPLISHMGLTPVLFIILGGVMYSLGAILYGVGSKKKYIHCVFHFFCIFGTIFHFTAIYGYLI